MAPWLRHCYRLRIFRCAASGVALWTLCHTDDHLKSAPLDVSAPYDEVSCKETHALAAFRRRCLARTVLATMHFASRRGLAALLVALSGPTASSPTTPSTSGRSLRRLRQRCPSSKCRLLAAAP